MTERFSRFSVPDYLNDPEMAFEYIKALEEDIAAQAKRIAELEAALKPFADMAKDAEWFDPYDGFEVAATHCLAARKVLDNK